MNRPITVFVALAFTACATNPARRITANDVEVVIHDEADKPAAAFNRGDETLDEQEFYEAIGDTPSLEAVQSSRSRASLLQSLGVGIATVGIALGAGAFGTYLFSGTTFSDQPPIVLSDDMRTLTMYGGIAGIALAAAGIALTMAMGPKVRGDAFVFDTKHARARLEVGRYGEGGATPEVIHSLSFGDGNEGQPLCANGSLTLAPLVAKDDKGRMVKVSDRADWFSWKTTPAAELLEHSPDAPVLHSPIGPGFAAVDDDVGVKIAVTKTGVGHEMTFGQSFACGAAFSFSGADGDSGSSGRSGRRGSDGRSDAAAQAGASASDGADGSPGANGPHVVVELAWITTSKRGRLALMVSGDQATLFDPSRSKAVVTAAGGVGGKGGSGGDGGSGGEGKMMDCQAGANGGAGGRGGRGGTGGAGGHIEIRATDRTLLNAIEGLAPGGSGGNGGDGGDGGRGGSGSSCGKSSQRAPKGASGPSGVGGSAGSSGADGTVTERVVPATDLDKLARVLAANPQLSAEVGTARTADSSTPRRKRR
jgi:hypothetical protein